MQGVHRQVRRVDLDVAFTPVAETESSGCFGAAASLIKLLLSCSRNEFAPPGQLLPTWEVQEPP